MNLEDQLRDLRPTAATLDGEWPASERAEMLGTVLADEGRSARARFVPRRHPVRRIAVPVAAAAVAALMAGLLLVAMPDGRDGRTTAEPLGTPFNASGVVSTPQPGAGQYAFRETTAYVLRKGRLVAIAVTQDWVAADGTTWTYRTDDANPKPVCFQFRHSGAATFGNATRAFLDSLPTDESDLRGYMRSHVSGSTSRDEAVFVAVGDALGAADLLASSSLRAGFVAVLSRNGGTAVRRDVTDSRGRPAVRADFVDARNRPGELQSLYFDVRTFQLVEMTTRSTTPSAYASQSYDVVPPRATTPRQLPPARSTSIVTDEKVVDRLPAKVRSCPVEQDS